MPTGTSRPPTTPRKVSLAIATNPGGGTLSGGAAVTVASGIATFSGLSIDKAGTGYTLAASSTPSYTGATSTAFNVGHWHAAGPGGVPGRQRSQRIRQQ